MLDYRSAGGTVHLRLQGADGKGVQQSAMSNPQGAHSYGLDYPAVHGLPGSAVELAPGLTEAMVRFAARHEYAVTVEDVLARRARVLFLDARLAARLAPQVARILAEETGLPPQEAEFVALAAQYTEIPA